MTADVYSIPYQLFDLDSPPDCATTTDSVTVINSSIVPNPNTGTADFGVGSQPIANIAANASTAQEAVGRIDALYLIERQISNRPDLLSITHISRGD